MFHRYSFSLFGFVNTDFSTINLFINAIPMSKQELIVFDVSVTEEFQQGFAEAQLLHGSGILPFCEWMNWCPSNCCKVIRLVCC